MTEGEVALRLVLRCLARCRLTVPVTALCLVAVGCATTSAEGRDVILNVVMADDWAQTPAVVDVIRRFERAHPHVRVDVRPVPFSQIPDSVLASMDSDEVVDVAHWHPFAAAARGLAQPLDSQWAQHLTVDEFLPGAYQDVLWDGVPYGVPLDTNAMLLMVNGQRLGEAGVDVGSLDTFAALERAAEAVNDTDPAHRGLAIPASSWVVYGVIRANGGEVVDFTADGEARFSLDAPEVVEAVSWLGDLVDRGLAYPPNSRNEPGDAFALFRAGATAMHVSGTWDLATLRTQAPGWDAEVLPVPQGPSGDGPATVLGGSGLFVPVGSDHADLAFAFMLALIEDEIALRLAEEEGRLPVRHRVLADPFFASAEQRTVVEALEVAHPMRLIAFPEADQAFAQAIEDVLLGRRSAEEALTAAQAIAEREHGPSA